MKQPGELPPELQSLIVAEQNAPTGSSAEHRRIRARLGIGLGVLGVTAGESAASGGAVAGSAGAIGSSLIAKVLAATMALGAAAGGGYLLGRKHGAESASPPAASTVFADEPEREVRAVGLVEAPPVAEPPPEPAPVVEPEPGPEPEPEQTPPRRARPPIAPSDPVEQEVPVVEAVVEPPATAEAPAEETALIVAAWRAVEAGDFMAADVAIESHERRFSDGVLAEERDALRVRNLILSGERHRAEQRASEFLARYPASVHTAAVKRALKGAE